MKKVILVSGTPGTGKTSIAKQIAEHYDYEYVHIGEHEDYIIGKEETKIIDVDKMIEWVKKRQNTSNKRLVLDSHLSHYYPADKTKLCIITRCEPSELRTRLKRREYSSHKISLNLEAEAIDLVLQEALSQGHQVYEIDTTHKTVNTSAREAIRAIEEDKTKYGEKDYSQYIKKNL